eukprot:CAMPEP_0114136766 /NCGR_PEP_ID=MMETSP0043_2-20121206/15413_1 /TAXON_ID=464988 /ORGANISM="Hemiselmis andersenii, Strain CCMP644" /LENGTH=47 /DNA_ID= /DNA_START= /DNA_END= /DNA_ORIENTATION=
MTPNGSILKRREREEKAGSPGSGVAVKKMSIPKRKAKYDEGDVGSRV